MPKIISNEEKALLESIEESNDSDVSLWIIGNIVIPITSIALSLVCIATFKNHDESVDAMAYLNLLLNGSIPMLSLNRIGGKEMITMDILEHALKEYP